MTIANWQRSIEQIALRNRRYRILGLTSARRGAGVSVISRLLARTLATSGSNTILVDLSHPQGGAAPEISAAPVGSLRAFITPSAHGFDLLAGTTPEVHRAATNLLALRELLMHDLSKYQHIILDFPPILDDDQTGFSTVLAATICDGLLLVGAVGKDKRAELVEALSLLRSSGTTISGVVSNEGIDERRGRRARAERAARARI